MHQFDAGLGKIKNSYGPLSKVIVMFHTIYYNENTWKKANENIKEQYEINKRRERSLSRIYK